MTTTTTTTKPASERAQKTRENQEKRLMHVRGLIQEANNGSKAARLELLATLTKANAYHNTGKIEGLYSLDTACSNNAFCPRMQATDDPRIICRYCYAQSMWDAARFAHHITGEILSGVELTPEEAQAIPIFCPLFRFNSDGELINHAHAVNLIRIAATHPETNFSIWTKRPAVLDEAIKAEEKPENLICGISSPRINTPFASRFSWVDFVFTVYTPEGMRRALARGEHECNGKKCMDCGFYCYRKHTETAGPVYVAEALRKPKGIKKEAFPGIIAAIDAATLDN